MISKRDHLEWVACLDNLRSLPFFADYKARVVELISPRPGGQFLDVGAGTGDDALTLSRIGGTVTTIDSSQPMVEEAKRRGVACVVLGDAAALPFRDDMFSAVTADRTLQHVRSPRDVVRELVRVTQPGGTVVVVDPDYGTQSLAVADQQVANRVLRYRAQHMVRHGTLAHCVPAILASFGAVDLTVETRTLMADGLNPALRVLGLRSWAAHGQSRGHITSAEAIAWESTLDTAIADGTFLYTLSFYITTAHKRCSRAAVSQCWSP